MNNVLNKIALGSIIIVMLSLNFNYLNNFEKNLDVILPIKQAIAQTEDGDSSRNDHTEDPINCTYTVWKCEIDILGYKVCFNFEEDGIKDPCTYWKDASCSPYACQ